MFPKPPSQLRDASRLLDCAGVIAHDRRRLRMGSSLHHVHGRTRLECPHRSCPCGLRTHIHTHLLRAIAVTRQMSAEPSPSIATVSTNMRHWRCAAIVGNVAAYSYAGRSCFSTSCVAMPAAALNARNACQRMTPVAAVATSPASVKVSKAETRSETTPSSRRP